MNTMEYFKLFGLMGYKEGTRMLVITNLNKPHLYQEDLSRSRHSHRNHNTVRVDVIDKYQEFNKDFYDYGIFIDDDKRVSILYDRYNSLKSSDNTKESKIMMIMAISDKLVHMHISTLSHELELITEALRNDEDVSLERINVLGRNVDNEFEKYIKYINDSNRISGNSGYIL